MIESTAQLAGFLRSERERILDAWEAEVRRIPDADRLPTPLLRDSIPDMLERIADALDRPTLDPSISHENAASHAQQRLRLGLDLSQVVAEYTALRRVCLRLAAVAGVSIQADEAVLFHGAIDRAVGDAIVAFTTCRYRALNALEEVTRSVEQMHDLDLLLTRLANVVSDSSESVDAAVVLLASGSRLYPRAASGVAAERLADFADALVSGIAGQVAIERRTIEACEGDALAVGPFAGMRALLGLPLVRDGAVIGVICVTTRSARCFSDEEKELLGLIADRAALLVAQSQLLMNVRASSLAAQALAGAESREQGMLRLAAAIGEHFGWDYAGFWTHADDDILQLGGTWCADAALRGFDEVSRAMRFLKGTGLPGRAWASGEVVWIADVRKDPNFPRRAAAERGGLVSAMAFPLRHGERTIAVLEFFSRRQRIAAEEGVQLTRALAGELVEFVGRIEAQEALRRRDAEMAAMLDAALDAIVWMDADGVVTGWNRAAEATFGYRSDEAIGQVLADLIIPPHLRERHARGLRRYVETGRQNYLDRRLEMPAIRRDGTEFPVELTITRARVPDAVVFTGYLRDITDRKLAEAERERLYREAQETTRQREMLLAVVSHDLRNPLNAVQLGAALLRRTLEVDAGAHRHVDTILRATTHMARLIDDLLDLAAIQAGRFSIRRAPLDLSAIVSEALQLHAPVARNKGVRLSHSLPPGELRVDGDRQRLVQVLSNLVGNAVKFCEAGAEVAVTAQAGDADVTVSVRDTGPGIAPDAIEHIFQPYWSASQHRTRGTGLGLFISRAIVESHGGRIWVDSRVGEGSTFSFTLMQSTSGEDGGETPGGDGGV